MHTTSLAWGGRAGVQLAGSDQFVEVVDAPVQRREATWHAAWPLVVSVMEPVMTSLARVALAGWKKSSWNVLGGPEPLVSCIGTVIVPFFEPAGICSTPVVAV